MKLRTLAGLIPWLWLIGASQGCRVHPENTNGATRPSMSRVQIEEDFDRVVSEYRKCTDIGKFLNVSANRATFALPTSAKRILGLGTNAVPLLEREMYSSNETRRLVALQALTLLRAVTNASQSSAKDSVTGIELTLYNVRAIDVHKPVESRELPKR